VQSALSQQVQRLERELGVRLLEYSTHHVSLTAAGTVFLAEARQIPAQVDRAAGVARSTAPLSRRGSASSTPATTRCRRSCTRSRPATRPGHPPGRDQRARAVPAAHRRPPGRRHRPGRARSAAGRLAAVPPGPSRGPGPLRSPVRRAGRHPCRRPGHPTAAARRRGPGSGIQPVHR
jgi:DNA-binding transcriptional LysR family regulator